MRTITAALYRLVGIAALLLLIVAALFAVRLVLSIGESGPSTTPGG